MGELKRDFDLKVAALHTETQLKLEQTEASVEARAMTRVDEVTKSTLIVNSRRLWEIENIHREMSEVRRDHDRMEKEYKAMKFEVIAVLTVCATMRCFILAVMVLTTPQVELKRVELRKFTDKIMLLKQTIAQQVHGEPPLPPLCFLVLGHVIDSCLTSLACTDYSSSCRELGPDH